MTKRAFKKFKRNKRDFYATPPEAVVPLTRHLSYGTTFDEPCAGDGALANHLINGGLAPAFLSDIEPRSGVVAKCDVFDVASCQADIFITNPPWDREILHAIITHLSGMAPTWLLFDADWMHTKQSIPFTPRLHKIISVGRVSWMGNGVSGFDNCAWYLFDKPTNDAPIFIGRS